MSCALSRGFAFIMASATLSENQYAPTFITKLRITAIYRMEGLPSIKLATQATAMIKTKSPARYSQVFLILDSAWEYRFIRKILWEVLYTSFRQCQRILLS